MDRNTRDFHNIQKKRLFIFKKRKYLYSESSSFLQVCNRELTRSLAMMRSRELSLLRDNKQKRMIHSLSPEFAIIIQKWSLVKIQ